MAVEREFEVSVAGEAVPGVVWLPDVVSGPLPALLMGHGRGDGKRSFERERPAQRWADGHGWAVVAIDAPAHGARALPAAGCPPQLPPIPDPVQARREWQATIERLIAGGVIDAKLIAYWGLSMGAALGISLIAHEPRIKCAVIGLMHGGYYDTIKIDAAQVSCPLLFSLHWNDERIPRAGGLELFGALGSDDKRLHVYPGAHNDFTAEEIDAGEAFLAARLTSS